MLELDTFDENEEPEVDDIVYTIMLHGRQMSEEVKVNPDDELPARAHARAHTRPCARTHR